MKPYLLLIYFLTSLFTLICFNLLINIADALILYVGTLIVLLLIFYYFLIVHNSLPKGSIAFYLVLLIYILDYLSPNYIEINYKIIYFLFPAIEVLFDIFLFFKLVTIYRKTKKSDSLYLIDSFENAMKDTLGNYKILKLVTAELLVFYYTIFGWFIKKKWQYPFFTNYKKSNNGVFLGVILFIGCIELPIIHILIANWSANAAWIFTIVNIYGYFWLIGDYNAQRHNPIIIKEGILHFRVGIRWGFKTAINNIKSLREYQHDNDLVLTAKTSECNLIIEFKEDIKITGLFGTQKVTKKIGCLIDNSIRFRQLVISYLSKD
ncbi:MAG: hypothetical protein OEY49_09335 [Candidatus Heimdallarchaeota archaeon]|nr:hypothetical protein [Candidatus Heimdallarchaeota archaeon]